VNDPIVFQKGIRVTIEHFGWMSVDENPQHKENSWNEREDDFSSVAFWYQTGQPTFADRAPADRHLPNIDRVIAYGRDGEAHGAGEVQKQQLDIYDGPQLLYMPSAKQIDEGHPASAWIEIPLTVTKKEPLRLLLNMTTSYDFGTYRASLNGVKLGGPMDFYSADVDNKEFHLLDFWPEPGTYVLRLECTGKNQSSRGYCCGLESVRLRERRPRVFQMGWDKDKDWKKNPTLY
jgi:hypothetical protein